MDRGGRGGTKRLWLNIASLEETTVCAGRTQNSSHLPERFLSYDTIDDFTAIKKRDKILQENARFDNHLNLLSYTIAGEPGKY